MRTLALRSVFVFAAFLIVMTGCQKERATETAVNPETISGILQDESKTFTADPDLRAGANLRSGKEKENGNDYPQLRFRFLTYALTRAGLVDDLAQVGPYTLFAPTDDAFRRAGFKNLNDLNAVPVETLQAILLYHVLSGTVLAAQVPAGPNAPVTTLNGATAYVTRTEGPRVFVNGAPVILADIMAANGVIHAIDDVLMPPVGDLVQTVVANPDYSLLVAAVLKASEGSVKVAEVLSGAGPFTLFAPTNDAFRKAGFPDVASINKANPDDLLSILTYHVISGRIFSSDLVDGQMPTMLNGKTTTISLNGFPRIKGLGNNVAARITDTNTVATNGVVHTIDRVLLP